MLAVSAAAALQCGLRANVLRGVGAWPPCHDAVMVADLARRGRRLSIGVMAGAVAARADTLVLQRLSTTTEVGLYAAGFRIIAGCLALAQATMLAAHPMLARMIAGRHRRNASRLVCAVMAISLAIALLPLTGVSVLLTHVFGGSFAASAPILDILWVVLACQILTTFSARALLASGRAGAVAPMQVVLAVCAPILQIELIQIQINSDPRRGKTEECPLNPVRIDSAVELELARQKLTGSSIPTLDQKVLIQSNGNMAFDVTDLVHPEVASQVALAARVVGLEIAGVDLVAQDISKPLKEQNAAIVEVNAGPGLLMHLKPASGKPQPVGKEIANHLFPPGTDFRIPVVGVCGARGKTPVAEMIAHFLRLTNLYVGLSCSKGLFFGHRSIQKSNAANWENARRTLLNRAVQAAVIENNNLSMLIEGLAYDRCQVGVVLNVDPTANFPQYAIYDEEQVFSIMRTQVDVVLPTGVAVLNADDPMVASMAELCDGEVIFFTQDSTSSIAQEHLKNSGRVVIVGKQQITLKSAKHDQKSIPVPRHFEPDASEPWKPMNLGAAIAAAWALDIPFNVIEAGAETFVSDASVPVGV
jgi:cyanophycin synthetase